MGQELRVEKSAKYFGTEAKGQNRGNDEHNMHICWVLARIYPSSR
jgi:hypothetical protein